MVALTDVKDVIAHTGNVIKIFGGNPVSMSPESELYEALKRSFGHSSCCTATKENCTVIRSDYCDSTQTTPTEDDSLTVKLFIHAREGTVPSQEVRDALEQLKTEIGAHHIDLLFVYLPNAHSVSAEAAEAVKVALDMKSRGEVSKVGVVDFCNTGLTRLHDYIHAYPDVNQVEVSRVCSVPPELKKFSQENGITMVSHSDPRQLIEDEQLTQLLCNTTEDSSPGKWAVNWVLRYTLTIKHRGVISSKGYIVSASRL